MTRIIGIMTRNNARVDAFESWDRKKMIHYYVGKSQLGTEYWTINKAFCIMINSEIVAVNIFNQDIQTTHRIQDYELTDMVAS